jgi:hypothetical protein
LNRLKKAKRDYYNNSPDARLKTDSAIKKEEQDFFRDMLEEQSYGLEEEIKRLKRMDLENPPKQTALIDDGVPKNVQLKLNLENRKKKIERLDKERGELEQARRQLKGIETLPFAWNVAFAEIMELDTGGFDIVIGNPPYVRQENIADPKKPADSITSADKRKYKQSLERAVFQSWPQFFDYKSAYDEAGKDPRKASGRGLSRRSDLYIYFYFVGLSLVAEKGIFCFITSNSWLDVGYGADLQEFLLKHCHVRKIIDNEVKRSFKSADVNTIIAVLEPLGDRDWKGLEQEARFVMTQLPFEQIGYPGVAFEEIEKAEGGKTTPEYRVRPVNQEKLLEESWEWPEDGTDNKTKKYSFNIGKYSANKWGGKYLRAPDIYWKIMEKAGDKLVPLGDVAEVRRGITTGANDFFFLVETGQSSPEGTVHVRNGDGWEGLIDKDAVVSAVQKANECNKLVFAPSTYLFFPGDKLTQLTKKYISYGEEKGYGDRSTCSTRSQWWHLPLESFSQIQLGFNYNLYDTGRTYRSNEEPTYFSDSFHILSSSKLDILHAYMNSALFHLFININARVVFGGGKAKLQTYELTALPCPRNLSDILDNKKLEALMEQMATADPKFLPEEFEEEWRQELDNIIFTGLGLDSTVLDSVYESVTDIINYRMGKAGSV